MAAAIPSRIIELNRRISRALETGRGLRLEADDMDAIAMLDGFAAIEQAASEALKEQARCRAQRKSFIDGGNSGSLGTASGMAASAARILPSGGMTPSGDGNAALARAQAASRKRA